MNHVRVRHTFEAGHRLPHLEGKCQSLHGHSWSVEVTVSGHVNGDGVLVMFAELKAHLRTWVDTHLDHGVMLGAGDPLAKILPEFGKTFLFTDAWPTVENVAVLLGEVMTDHLESTGESTRVHVSRVDVSETGVNSASWTRV